MRDEGDRQQGWARRQSGSARDGATQGSQRLTGLARPTVLLPISAVPAHGWLPNRRTPDDEPALTVVDLGVPDLGVPDLAVRDLAVTEPLTLPREGQRRISRRVVLAALLVVLAVVVGVAARVVTSRAGAVQRDDRTSTLARRSPPVAASVGASTVSNRAPGSVGPVGSVGSVGSVGMAPGDAAAAGTVIVVDVIGRVRHPGLARLPPGSRVADAIAAVGGPSGGAAVSRVNLARKLVDGEQLLVPGPHDAIPGALTAGGGASDGAGGGPTVGSVGDAQAGPAAPLDLNAATPAQLDGLPGVGPVTAGRIIAWRSQHQRFSRVDELGEVPGIGPKMLERLRPLVRV